MINAKSLNIAAGIMRKLSSYSSGSRSYSYLKRITLYHRIQGSPELKQVIESIEALLVDEAPDLVEVSSYRYTGKSSPQWFSLPVSWNIFDAWLQIGERKYRFQSHPTLPAAHTPPSDGVVTGKVVRINDPIDPSSYEHLSDKIPLITKHHRVAYRIAAEKGVPGVILASRERNHRAFPYIGLFLSESEASKYTTPAVTIPWELVEGINDKEVRFKVDADIGKTSEVPVLIAWIGDQSNPGPAIISHICHPKPGANDNASGVSAGLDAFISIAEAIEDGILEEPEQTIRLILVPEYSGSILLMEGWMSNININIINIDMIARSLQYANPPRLTYTPITVGASKTGDTVFDVILASNYQHILGVDYYMAGSDHDVFIGYNRDAVMLNQWPDPFYHTDQDDANTIDPQLLEEASTIVGVSAYLLASNYLSTGLARRYLLDKLIVKASKRGEVDALLAYSIARIRYRIEGDSYHNTGWSPVKDDRKIISRQPLYTGVLNPQLTLDDKIGLARILEELKNSYNILNEIFYAGMRDYTIKRLHTELASIYPDYKDPNKLLGLLEALESYKLLKII